MKKQQVATLLAAVIVLVACSSPDAPVAQSDHRTVVTTIVGQVIDSVGNAVVGAVVSVGERTQVTSEWGSFVFRDVRVRHDRCIVEMKLREHYDVVVVAHPVENGLTPIRLQPLYAAPYVVESSRKNMHAYAGTAELVLPPNNMADHKGNPYEYDASISMHYWDPSMSCFTYIAPGDMMALSLDGRETIVQPIALARSAAYTEDNMPLQLRSGAKAQLKIGVRPSDLANAKLYRFDREVSMWVELPGVKNEGSNLTCEVTSIGDWLVAVPSEGVAIVSGKILCSNGTTLPGATVRVNGAHAIADEHGVYRALIPARRPLDLSLRSEDNRFVSAAVRMVGPVEPGVTLTHDIIVPECPPVIDLKLVGCDSTAVPGMVWLSGLPQRVFFSERGQVRATAVHSMSYVSARSMSGATAPSREYYGVVPGVVRDGGTIVLCKDTVRPFLRIGLTRDEDVGHVALDQTGTAVAVMSPSHVTCYDVESGRVRWKAPTPIHGGREPVLFFTQASDKLAFSSSLGSFVLRASDGSMLARSGLLGYKRLTSDASRLWIVPYEAKSSTSEIHEYDVNSNTLLRTIPLTHVPENVWFIGLHQDHIAVMQTLSRQELLLLDLEQGDTVRMIRVPADQSFHSVALHGSHCAFTMQRGTSNDIIVIYDLETGAEVQRLSLPGADISLCGMSSKGLDVVTYTRSSNKFASHSIDAPNTTQVIPSVIDHVTYSTPDVVFSGDRHTVAACIGVGSNTASVSGRYIYVYRLK